MLTQDSSATVEQSSHAPGAAAVQSAQDQRPTPIDHTDGLSAPTPETADPCAPAPVCQSSLTPVAINQAGRGGRGGRGVSKSRAATQAGRGRAGTKTGSSRDDSGARAGPSTSTPADKNTAALALMELSCASSSRPAGGVESSSTTASSDSTKPAKKPAAPAKRRHADASPTPDAAPPAAKKAKSVYPAPQQYPLTGDGSREPSPFDLGDVVSPAQDSVIAPDSQKKKDKQVATEVNESAPGKQPRSQSDVDVEAESCPESFQKRQHETTGSSSTDDSEEMARVNESLARAKTLLDIATERNRVLRSSEGILAREVDALRKQLRSLGVEKQDALEKQRRQLRPGLVTMKLTPRVQERVSQIFGSGGQGAGSSTAAPAARAQAAKRVSVRQPEKKAHTGDLGIGTAHRGSEKLTAAALSRHQASVEAAVVAPPMGFFRSPVARRSTQPSSTLAPSSKPSNSKTSNREAAKLSSQSNVDVHDNGEESDVPTESSWASEIPA